MIPFPFVTDKTVKQGLTVFPTLPDSFFADFTDSGPKATLVICVKAALTGKPCPGVLNVRLPNKSPGRLVVARSSRATTSQLLDSHNQPR